MDKNKFINEIDRLTEEIVEEEIEGQRAEQWLKFYDKYTLTNLEKKYLISIKDAKSLLLKDGYRETVDKMELIEKWVLEAQFRGGMFKGNNAATSKVMESLNMVPNLQETYGDIIFVDLTPAQHINLIKTLKPIYNDVKDIIDERAVDILKDEKTSKKDKELLKELGYK